jgi:serine/threonine-protein kinase RsbW
MVFEEDDRVRLVMPASLECVDRAVDAAASFLAGDRGWTGLFPALTALREALLNAVIHGCCDQAPGLTITCSLAVEGHMAVIEVSDPGRGFDWRERSPSLPGPEATFGRGLCIMNFYADSVEYNAAGNTLTIRVNLA